MRYVQWTYCSVTLQNEKFILRNYVIEPKATEWRTNSLQNYVVAVFLAVIINASLPIGLVAILVNTLRKSSVTPIEISIPICIRSSKIWFIIWPPGRYLNNRASPQIPKDEYQHPRRMVCTFLLLSNFFHCDRAQMTSISETKSSTKDGSQYNADEHINAPLESATAGLPHGSSV